MTDVVNVSLLTTGRMDWNYIAPLARELQQRPEIKLRLLVSGTHLLSERGKTVQTVRDDGFAPDAEIPVHGGGDEPLDVATAMGRGVLGFAAEFHRHRPDILIVNGDRFETLAVVAAARAFTIVIAHIGGGEVTAGAMDDDIRHAISKLSHLHFTECEAYRVRLLQMGEKENRVFAVGSLSIEAMRNVAAVSLPELRRRLRCDIQEDFLLVTFHPVTLVGREENRRSVSQFLQGLEHTGFYSVFTFPNIDTHSSVIVESIEAFLARRPEQGCFIVNAGRENYYNLMRLSRAVVGNSSSGIIETPFFKVPAVNVGERQEGRVRADNVIDCGYAPESVKQAVEMAVGSDFGAGLETMVNPFFNTAISHTIVDRILEAGGTGRDELVKKNFVDRAMT